MDSIEKTSKKKEKKEFDKEDTIDYKDIEEIRNKAQLTSDDIKKYLEERSVKNH